MSSHCFSNALDDSMLKMSPCWNVWPFHVSKQLLTTTPTYLLKWPSCCEHGSAPQFQPLFASRNVHLISRVIKQLLYRRNHPFLLRARLLAPNPGTFHEPLRANATSALGINRTIPFLSILPRDDSRSGWRFTAALLLAEVVLVWRLSYEDCPMTTDTWPARETHE